MTGIRFLQLDVFSEQVGGGNPLGVVIGAEHWTDATMQRFAAWTDLVETTYLLPPTTPAASYRLRIFTPKREIAFAGHPTVGSAHAALEAGLVHPVDGELVQECGAGLLPVRVDGAGAQRMLAVAAPAARTLPTLPEHAALLAAALRGVATGTLPPGFVEGGRRWWVAELADEAQLRGWRPDHAAILRLAEATDSLGLCVFARSRDAGYQLAVRAFPAGVGIVEDPASGAANGLIAAYLLEQEPHGPLAAGYTVSQGREMGRDASIRIDCDSRGRIWVGGRSHTVVDGTLRWS